MKLSKRFRILIGLACLTALFSGCAAQQPQQARRFFWPPLPERPRIEWLKAYSSQLDFPKEGFSALMAKIAGEDEAITFSKPLDITSDGKGKVYITDAGNQSVYVYDLVNRGVHLLGKEESTGLFKQVIGVALDATGNIYVSDADKNAVLVFTADEKPLRVIELGKNVQKASAIAIDSSRKRLYVVDTRGHKVAGFGLDGNFLFNFGQRGDADGAFNFPIALDVNHQGEVVVGDTMNARVQIFDGEGKFLRKFGNRGDGPADFQIIKGLAVDSEDNIYVTDGKGHKVVIYSTRGEWLITVGGQYSVLASGKEAPGGFLIPQGIDIDKNDTIFVVDQLNRRFQMFQYLSDRYLRENPIPGVEIKP